MEKVKKNRSNVQRELIATVKRPPSLKAISPYVFYVK